MAQCGENVGGNGTVSISIWRRGEGNVLYRVQLLLFFVLKLSVRPRRSSFVVTTYS